MGVAFSTPCHGAISPSEGVDWKAVHEFAGSFLHISGSVRVGVQSEVGPVCSRMLESVLVSPPLDVHGWPKGVPQVVKFDVRQTCGNQNFL